MQRYWVLMNGSRFWGGSGWITEYPDARIYLVTNGEQLRPTAMKVHATHIVADYGTTTEKRLKV